MGYAAEEAEGRPVIAILNSWSDLSQCHTHFPERVEQVKRGVWQAGGFPLEIPVLAVSEMFMKPTAMFYRNLLAMEVEEVLRRHPVDAAVLMGRCGKTVPGVLLGAISATSDPPRSLPTNRTLMRWAEGRLWPANSSRG